ncbi:hypothetical protein Tco_1017815 [Tanacetum coccineum]|uniref:Uncharacterized protein n=1 Tax=Tanacetum coccineum TaxID=301880 RepID=A0ABQ5FSK3_9ASTR
MLYIYEDALRKCDQMPQTFDKSSLAMTHKLDDIIELPKSQPKKTYEEDLEYEMVMVKMPSPQSTPQVLLSFEEYTPPVTYRKEVEKTLKPLMEEESLNQTQLEDVGFDSYDYNFSLSSMEVLSVDKLEPQLLPSFPSVDVSLGDERGLEPPIKPHSSDSFRMKAVDHLTIHIPPSPHVVIFDEGKPESS